MNGATLLICKTCGTRNSDPGELPESYACGRCGNMTLVRVQPPPPDAAGQTVTGAAIGGTLGALMFGVPGAFVGALVGGAIGNRAKT